MKGLFNTTWAFLLVSSAAGLLACSAGESTGSAGAAGTSSAKLYVSERLSLAIYLDDGAENMSVAEQFAQDWPFDVPVKPIDGEEVEVVNNCAGVIPAYEQGKWPVEIADHQAYRQIVYLCYGAELVSKAGNVSHALEPLGIGESWLARLPAALAPVESAPERERLLIEMPEARWTDANTLLNSHEEEPGLAMLETPSQIQVINVLAKGRLGGGSDDDLLVFSVSSTLDDSPETMQLFLLGRSENGASYKVVREF